MIDRSIAPTINGISSIPFPDVETSYLDNGIPVYEINLGTQDVIKVELVINGGRLFEQKEVSGRATANQLKEGTAKYSGKEIADFLDFYGCTLSTPFNLDTTNIAFYSLNKHFDKALPVLESMLKSPVFPKAELDAYIIRNQKRLEVELSKNDVVAYRLITENIFGADHPYGYNSSAESFGALTREDLLSHFERCYNASNIKIFVSGQTKGAFSLLNKHLGNIPSGSPLTPNIQPVHDRKPMQIVSKSKGDYQVAIRIGRNLFNRKHEDFLGTNILVTILGGYFGSRLMTNIREEKGFTYNIYSAIDTMTHGGYFYIGTEVGNEFKEATLKEIYKEIEVLKEEFIPDEEMEMVRSYLLGNLLTSVDGPFATAETVKSLVIDDLPYSYFGDMVEKVKSFSREELRDLAKKYFGKEDMWEVVVE